MRDNNKRQLDESKRFKRFILLKVAERISKILYFKNFIFLKYKISSKFNYSPVYY